MPIQYYAVEDILRQLPKNIQNTVKSALNEWENKNKALTRAILAGLHRIPAPVKVASGMVCPTIFKPLLSLIYGAPTVLEYAIIKLAEQAARKGTLTEENRREFEEFISYKSVSLPKSSKSSKRR